MEHKVLGREEILAAKDVLELVRVEIPEWGGVICLRPLSAGERDRFEETMMDRRGRTTRIKRGTNFRARLVAWSVVDEAGNRLFSDGDIAALAQRSSKVISRLFDECCKISGIGAADEEEYEQLEENLDKTGDNGSNTGWSPVASAEEQ